MSEREYQRHIIERLRACFPDCVILKNDSSYLQGIPDLSVFYKSHWAMLEVKLHADAPYQPNQLYYLELLDRMSFASVIHPGNEELVFDAIQSAFGTSRQTRLFEPEQL